VLSQSPSTGNTGSSPGPSVVLSPPSADEQKSIIRITEKLKAAQ
jgi:hypothetical protein